MTSSTPRYGHQPIAMRRVADEDAIERAGDFAWMAGQVGEDGVRYLAFAIPRPTESDPAGWRWQLLPVKQGSNETGRHWGWDGNEDTPTLTPSIHAIGDWHGWVRGGNLVEA